MKEMYLDSNAHLPMNPKALEAFNIFNKSTAGHGNPSAVNLPGRLAQVALEDARAKIARLIGAEKPSQIIFTSTCTGACTWGLQILNNIDREKNLDSFISPVEHPAVRDSFENIFGNLNELQINKNGKIQDQDVTNTKIACVHVQNEIGLIQSLEHIKCKYLFSDMSQSLGKIPINVSGMNVDIASFASHKIGGGMLGILYLKNTNHWKAFDSGSRYYMDRAGTPDVAGIVATAVAIESAVATLSERTKNMISFRDTLEPGLERLGFEIIAKEENRCPNTTFAKTPKSGQGIDLVFKLNEKNIFVGAGSACGSMFSGGSPLMAKLNRPSDGPDYIRISQFGEYNSTDAEYFLEKLNEVA